MQIDGLAPKPRTASTSKENRVYPYLLRGLGIAKPDQARILVPLRCNGPAQPIRDLFEALEQHGYEVCFRGIRRGLGGQSNTKKVYLKEYASLMTTITTGRIKG